MAEAAPGSAGAGAAVVGGVRLLLRLEGAGLLVAALAGYAWLGAGWGSFALLFLLPDLAMLGYLAGARVGAVAYNATHSLLGPLVLGASGMASASAGGPAAPVLQALALVWVAHIGFDRMLGYGLKYRQGFGFTHLGRIGRAQATASANTTAPRADGQAPCRWVS